MPAPNNEAISLDTNPILYREEVRLPKVRVDSSLHYLQAILLFDQTRIIFQNILYYIQSKMIF